MLDNIWTLVILYTAMNLPIAVWMMRSFFLEVPRRTARGGQMDGAPLRRTVREVILPRRRPGDRGYRADLLHLRLERVLLRGEPDRDAGRRPSRCSWSASSSSEGLYFAQLAAAATVAALPVILAGWVAQRYLVRGLSFGAIK